MTRRMAFARCRATRPSAVLLAQNDPAPRRGEWGTSGKPWRAVPSALATESASGPVDPPHGRPFARSARGPVHLTAYMPLLEDRRADMDGVARRAASITAEIAASAFLNHPG